MAAKHYAGHGIVEQIEAYDHEHPVISNVTVSDISAAGYTVTCTVTDNWEISNVAFPTWTLLNDQDDLAADFLKTQTGTKNGNTYTFRVNASEHNNETGKYVTHIYATDRGGNRVSVVVDVVDVKDPLITLVTDSAYTKDGGYICNVTVGTTVNGLFTQFANTGLEVVDANGVAISGIAVVGTGTKINLYQNNAVVDTVIVVVCGDTDGDGAVDTTDYLRVKSSVLGRFTLTAAQLKAADMDQNGVVDAADHQRIKSYFLGTYNLTK
jgi:hypothetical protein